MPYIIQQPLHARSVTVYAFTGVEVAITCSTVAAVHLKKLLVLGKYHRLEFRTLKVTEKCLGAAREQHK